MAALSQVLTLGKGEWLIRKGQPFDKLCVVIEGSLEASFLRRNGHRHLVDILKAGELAGLSSLIDGQGHVSDLCARQADTILLQVSGDTVRRLREIDLELGRAFEAQLAACNRRLHGRVTADESQPLEARLAWLLQSLADRFGEPTAEGITIDLKISQADLGDWLGVTRQRINTVMQKLRMERLIRLRYSGITIVNAAGLVARAGH